MQEVAKNAIKSFQSLKGAYFRSSVDECVQFVTENRIQEMDQFRDAPVTNFQKEKARKPTESEMIINYKDIEEILTKNLEKATETIKNAYHRKSNIVLQTRKLFDEQKSIMKRVLQKLRKLFTVYSSKKIWRYLQSSWGTLSLHHQQLRESKFPKRWIKKLKNIIRKAKAL
jgi:tRNA nucleotidyltransferase/poly(A) polymerase